MDWRVALGHVTHNLVCEIWTHINLIQDVFEGVLKKKIAIKLGVKQRLLNFRKPNQTENNLKQKDNEEGMAASSSKHCTSWITALGESNRVKSILCF